MSTNQLIEKAVQSLKDDILPRLLEQIESVPYTPADSLSDDLKFLLKEGDALIGFLAGWAGVKKSPEEKKVALPLDDDQELINAETNKEMSEDDAYMLMAQMDEPLEEKAATPVSDATGEMSDDEAAKLLAMMDESAPATAAAAEAKESKPPESSKPAASSHDHSDEESENLADENVTEIEEFGQSEFGSDPDMIKDFLNNSEELLQILDDQILALEQNPSESSIIEEIFRAAHTLKGAAGMFAFKAIERVMHRMENFFDQVRKGKREATSEAIDVILEAMDIIKALIQAVKDGKPSGKLTAPIVRSLNLICSGKSAPKTKKTDASKEGAEDKKPEKEKNSKKKVEQSTIRVDLKRLDALVNLVGELVIDRTRFISIEEQLRTKTSQGDVASNMTETVQLFGRHMNEIQDIIMKVRMVPIGNSFNKFPRVVRDLAKSLNKEIDLVIEGEETELDKTLVEQIGDPLVHLIRNAVDHGIELPDIRAEKGKNRRGRVLLSARQEGNQIILKIEDDGKGMDREVIRAKGIEKGLISKDANLTEREILNLIFEAGFSTAQTVTNISGRGVGMDVVKKQISKLKGNIDLSSAPGKGSTIAIQLPLTLAIVKSLLVQARKETFAIPLSTVVESLRIKPTEIQRIGEAEVIKRRNTVLPLLYLHEALSIHEKQNQCWYVEEDKKQGNSIQKATPKNERLFVVVVGNAERRFGIVVDSLLNQQEMVIKSMGPMMREIPCVAGGAILGNGEVVLVLDIGELESVLRAKSRGVAA